MEGETAGARNASERSSCEEEKHPEAGREKLKHKMESF